MSDAGLDQAPEGEGLPLTHVDPATGRARMVDVSAKPWTNRRAVARCRVALGRPVASDDDTGVRREESAQWGEVFAAARVAGVQAAKQTSKLIPLCHSLTGSGVQVTLSLVAGAVEVESQAEVTGPTGVEMEALTACAVAALTVVAAVSPLDPGTSIEDLTLWEKSGGRSGRWVRV